MQEWLTTLAPYGPVAALLAIIALGLRMILNGSLVHRRQLEDLRADTAAQLADKNGQVETWRKSYEQSESARTQQSEQVGTLLTQVGQLLAQGQTTEHLIRELQETARAASSRSGPA